MRREQSKSNTLQRGFTLIEFMVVAALISMAVAFTIIQFGKANDSRVISQTLKDIDIIANAYRQNYDPMTKYTKIGLSGNGDSLESYIPPYMKVTRQTSSTLIEDAISFTTKPSTTTAGFIANSFFVTFTMPLGDNCARLASRLSSKNYINFNVGSTAVTSYSAESAFKGAVTKPCDLGSTDALAGKFSLEFR